MYRRSAFRRLLLGCLAGSLLGARLGTAPAAPIPVADLVEGFSPTFLYLLSPDGRHVLRRDLRSFDLVMFPVAANGEVGRSVEIGRHRMRFMVWARDGSRLYGVRYRKRTPFVLAIDPARPGGSPARFPFPASPGG